MSVSSATSTTTSGTTTGNTGSATTSALGLGSGLDLNTIIDGLMKIEAQQQTRLKTQVTNHTQLVNVYQQLNAKYSTLQTAAQGLNLPTNWMAKAATSSSANVTATASISAISGSLSFVVKNLASAQTVASTGTVASTDTVVGSGKFLLGLGGAIGLANVTGTGLADGAHTMEVTQASTGASQSGSTALPASVTFTGAETITLNAGGSPKTITMQAGTYSASQLNDMITQQSGGVIKATTNNNGSLKLTTANEGSASSLQITGGTALSALGLAAGGTSNGTNGIVKVDGVANNVTDIRADGSNAVVLNGSAGTISASFSGGLRVGTANYKSIDLGDGKLSTVVSNINSAAMGVTASAVQIAPGQFKLQMQSATTGTAGQISASLSSLGSMGKFSAVSEGKDAQIQVGTGAGAYTVSSSSNTVSDVLPGVTMKLTKADPSELVTINVAGDVDNLTTKVGNLVSSMNDALKYIADNSTYDQKTGSSGWLLGNSTASRLKQSAYGVMQAALGSGAIASDVGITVNQDGTFKFDTAKFQDAYAKDPEKVAAMFVEGGTKGTTSTTDNGIAQRVAALTKQATDSINGTITIAIKGENTTIDDLNKQITSWDGRLAQRRQTLLSMFSAMDTAVANFKAQGTWLSGQISKLG
jgi:flagellar hook-associated protein 2